MYVGSSAQTQRFPFCLVWTIIPGLSWLMPTVGHVGICKSDGTIYDFLGRGEIHKGQLGFGKPKKALNLYYHGLDPRVWDTAIEQASLQFSQTEHSLLSNNCHHHVARVLNLARYQGRTNWSAYDVMGLATAGQPIATI